MQKYLMRTETAADYLDMPVDHFEEVMAPILDAIIVCEERYYMSDDVETMARFFFKRPGGGEVVPFPA